MLIIVVGVAVIRTQDNRSTLNLTATNDVIVSCMASNEAGNSPIMNATVMVVSETGLLLKLMQ